ncbi:MAG: RNA polymerase subunit sigma-70, partial [Oscillospiraceae bacterium]|nr:RNA polymerase subunit sigma-70 [Oscillospiraceae bacterium]
MSFAESGNPQDAEACVNDTYLKTWHSIPPHKPNLLSAFVGKIVRNISVNKYKANHSLKRGG